MLMTIPDGTLSRKLKY